MSRFDHPVYGFNTSGLTRRTRVLMEDTGEAKEAWVTELPMAQITYITPHD